MIIFDTNALRGLNRQSPKFAVLRALKHSGVQPVSVPWMVLEEMVAFQVLDYQDAHRAALSACKELKRKMPWAKAPEPPALDVDLARDWWRAQYQEVLDVLETSGDAALRALAREAYCEKPANIDRKKKGGARDAAIWLTVIDYLAEHPDAEVFFVTDNSGDFGDGRDYPEPMAGDLADMADRLTRLASFDDVLHRFARPVDINSEQAKELLDSLLSESPTPLETAAKELLQGASYQGTPDPEFGAGVAYEEFRWHNWLVPPAAHVRDVSEVSGHQIEDSTWYTATVEWYLVGLCESNTRSPGAARDLSVARTGCQWRTKVLFSDRAGELPTLIEYDAPVPLDPAERDRWEPLFVSLRKQSATAAMLSLLLVAIFQEYVRQGPGRQP